MSQIERINKMEQLFDFVSTAIKDESNFPEKFAMVHRAITVLSEYYQSDDWKQDYTDDEAGLIPKNVKRGVLSEDGLWNLLSECEQWEKSKQLYRKTNSRMLQKSV